jgi:hypothetical protein
MHRVKYPRTFHLPWSLGATSDDKTLTMDETISMFKNVNVVITEKLDGENTTIYSDGFVHARSIDSKHHPSRDYIKSKADYIASFLPKGWRLFIENCYATHSLLYQLPDYIILFGGADEDNNALEWDTLVDLSQDIGLTLAPVLYEGIFTMDIKRMLEKDNTSKYGREREGYIIRRREAFKMSEFNSNVAKFVRENHVQTDEHWMQQPIRKNLLMHQTFIIDEDEDFE